MTYKEDYDQIYKYLTNVSIAISKENPTLGLIEIIKKEVLKLPKIDNSNLRYFIYSLLSFNFNIIINNDKLETNLGKKDCTQIIEKLFIAKGELGSVVGEQEETVVHPDNGFGKIIHIKAEGGMVDESEEELDADASLAAAAMAKRRRMASGGEVDIREGGGEDPEIFPKRNTAALKENYESEEMDEVHDPMRNPGDPAEAAMENEDDEDMIASARRRMKMKSPMTR